MQPDRHTDNPSDNRKVNRLEEKLPKDVFPPRAYTRNIARASAATVKSAKNAIGKALTT
jgi:hypothetical protein